MTEFEQKVLEKLDTIIQLLTINAEFTRHLAQRPYEVTTRLSANEMYEAGLQVKRRGPRNMAVDEILKKAKDLYTEFGDGMGDKRAMSLDPDIHERAV